MARLGTALQVMAKENRDAGLGRGREEGRAPLAKLTVPMILFFLPVLFVVILGPAILRVAETCRRCNKPTPQAVRSACRQEARLAGRR